MRPPRAEWLHSRHKSTKPTSLGTGRRPTGALLTIESKGPTLVIEYAPQRGTNHIHTIIRDPSNDYGKELTKS